MNLTLLLLQAAQGAQGTKGALGGYNMIFFMLLIFVAMWFFMIRPQQKKQKELNNFRNSLEIGQKVITAGGIYGKIKEIKDTYVLIEIDNNVHIRIDKNMIMRDPAELQQGK